MSAYAWSGEMAAKAQRPSHHAKAIRASGIAAEVKHHRRAIMKPARNRRALIDRPPSARRFRPDRSHHRGGGRALRHRESRAPLDDRPIIEKENAVDDMRGVAGKRRLRLF